MKTDELTNETMSGAKTHRAKFSPDFTTWKRRNVSVFRSLANAESFAARCDKLHIVLLGDDEEIWVARASAAAKLERGGQQFA